jgi:hypothetical protein
MRILFMVLATLAATPASAGYDDSFYKAEFWSGEYPPGFAVVRRHVIVTGRTAMDRGLPRNVRCALPYKAVFHLWNTRRNKESDARYFTASKIVPMTAKEDFTFEDGSTKLEIKRGEVLEWLIYNGEGQFSVRIRGKEYAGQQEMLNHVDKPDDPAFVEDQWLSLRCENGVRAWLFFDDLAPIGADGEVHYAPGIGDWSGGMIEYGRSRDLK